MGVGIFFLTLWFGMTVVGDTAIHSMLMAALIVVLSSAGYYFSGKNRKR